MLASPTRSARAGQPGGIGQARLQGEWPEHAQRQAEVMTQPYWWPLPPLAGQPAPLEALVQGEAVENARGSFFRRRLVLDLDEHYGGCRIGDFLWLSAQSAAALARNPDLADVPLERVLFLDTETTGLAGGTGTYAFLVGLGYFRQDAQRDWHFVVDQCFMRSYAEERAMLAEVAERLDQHEMLLTFNGKAFDAPLLETRFLMSRMRVSLEDWLHFDLLPPARRLWRPAAGSCALQSLERHILNVGREDDIESFLIPAIYHQYLRDADGRYLQRVFNHNRADILAMVALAVRACGMLEMDEGRVADEQRMTKDEGSSVFRPEQVNRPVLSAAEYVGLGRVYEQMGNMAAAERSYRSALEGPLARDLRCKVLHFLAGLLKKTGRYDDAAAYWQAVVDEVPAQSVTALIELAKYWEHKRRDPARAHDLTLRAKSRWLSGLAPTERPLPGIGAWRQTPTTSMPDDFERRLERLEKKRRGLVVARDDS